MRLSSIVSPAQLPTLVLLIALARVALAIRDETMGSQLEEGVQHSPKKILHAHPEPNHSAQSGMSMAQTAEGPNAHFVPVNPVAMTVAVAETGILTTVEAQVRFKGGGTCLESLTIPPTPGVQLKPDWLFGVGCKLDKGAFCKCPWAPIYGCQTSGMFGLPGGITTDIIQRMGFCRLEPWVVIFPSVALVGGIIYFMPSSRRAEPSGSSGSPRKSDKSEDSES
ncbi:unnamed protein product [Durusdinium trenchii]|uniref:Uncharacterized protein n=1 Tax=Durusdinium trenchii TaxID=1381693 RepID=A0ABP0NWK8_9DINO